MRWRAALQAGGAGPRSQTTIPAGYTRPSRCLVSTFEVLLTHCYLALRQQAHVKGGWAGVTANEATQQET